MRVHWFFVVGAIAAAVHYFSVIALVSVAHLPPWLANIPAYCIALAVSYLGQSRLTFNVSKDTAGQTLRFAITSAGGLVLNCTAYAALLHFTRLDYRLALVVVIAGVAALSFICMRHWVFGAAQTAGT
jgi:putative flippase GtrA